MEFTGAKKFEQLCNDKNNIWMGIINVTPDSFSDGGKFNIKEEALKSTRTCACWSSYS